MNISQCIGWSMVFGAVGLLVAFGTLDLLVILVPLSLILAYGAGRSGQKTQADDRHQKGVA